MTTAASFYATWRDMSLTDAGGTDVTNLDQHPQSLPSVEIPAKFVETAGLDQAPLRAKGVGGDRILRATVVVITGTTGGDTHANRWSDMISMIDTLDTGIEDEGIRGVTYSIVSNPNYAGQYFAVVAEITLDEKGVR